MAIFIKTERMWSVCNCLAVEGILERRSPTRLGRSKLGRMLGVPQSTQETIKGEGEYSNWDAIRTDIAAFKDLFVQKWGPNRFRENTVEDRR